MADEPKVVTLVKKGDELAEAFASMRGRAKEIAKTRKAYYDAHISAGFTESQAMELCWRLTI